jgi:hypothetical protein
MVDIVLIIVVVVVLVFVIKVVKILLRKLIFPSRVDLGAVVVGGGVRLCFFLEGYARKASISFGHLS